MARLAGRFGVPRELPVAALVAAAALPLSRLFRPGGFTGVVLSAVALSLGVSWLARRLRLPAVVSLLLSAAVLLWYLAARFYSDTLFGIFPTPSSVRAIIAGVQAGAKETIDEAVPVVATAPLLMFVAAGTWVTAWLADAAAVWVGNPLLAIAATVPMFATPGTLVPSERRWVDTGLYVLAAAWILFAEERALAERWRSTERTFRLGWRPGPAVRIGLVGVLVVIVLSPFLPGYGASPLLRTRGPGQRITFNPFVAIRPTLRKEPEIPLFTVVTSRPTYMRLTTLEHFDGEVWSQGRGRVTTPINDNPIAPFAPGVQSEIVQQQYRIQALAGPWLPAAYDPISVSGIDGLKIETTTRALVLSEAGGLPAGARYDVTSRMPVLTASDLDQPFTYDSSTLSDYLELPHNVPRQVREIAQRIAGDLPTPYQKALALQNYLRTFTYDENVAAGHSFKNIVEFLTTTKRGYCEQFAGSMAVMARTLGLPSRVAIGFGFGQQVGENEFRETTKEAHAWVEIYFPDAGWVAFEPTPRAGVTRVPSYAAPAVSEAPSPTASPTPTASSTTVPTTAGADHGPAEDASGVTSNARGRPAWVFVAVIIGSAATLVALAFVLSLGLREIRRRRAHDVRSAAVVRYVEFLNWCAGAGLGRELGETPLEHAVRLGAEDTSVAQLLGKLAALADEALWAPDEDVDPAAIERSASDARSALGATLNRRTRILAATGWGRWRSAA
jgi:transglutaminase-like putative cysteine protease